jgi:hypothetical protein
VAAERAAGRPARPVPLPQIRGGVDLAQPGDRLDQRTDRDVQVTARDQAPRSQYSSVAERPAARGLGERRW